jgi:hypothetical protein
VAARAAVVVVVVAVAPVGAVPAVAVVVAGVAGRDVEALAGSNAPTLTLQSKALPSD